MARILLTTVWHTGTNYVRKELTQQGHYVVFQHCELGALSRAHKCSEVHTTYRDPFSVGASWANRYDMTDPIIQANWMTGWPIYQIVLKHYNPIVHHLADFTGARVNDHEDTHGMHEAYRTKDFEKYYAKMPEELMKFALKFAYLPDDV